MTPAQELQAFATRERMNWENENTPIGVAPELGAFHIAFAELLENIAHEMILDGAVEITGLAGYDVHISTPDEVGIQKPTWTAALKLIRTINRIQEEI